MLRRHWAAALIFLVLTFLLTNPLILNLWNAVEDKQDALLNTWIIAWVGHASITDPLGLYNANIFYPYPNTLAFSEVLVPQGLLALPFTLATNNSIFGYNLVLLAMFWLNGFAMYLLVLDWTKSRAAGWVAGVIYSFNPFNLGNLAQIQLLSMGWLPLALMFQGRILRGTCQPAGSRVVAQDAVLFVLFFLLQSLSSIYFALLAGFAVLVYFGMWLLKSFPDAVMRLTGQVKVTSLNRPHGFARSLTAFALSLLVLAALLIPFLLPYLSVEHELGFQRSVQESEPFSANLKQFTQVSPRNLVYGRWLAANPVKFEGGYPLDNLFPGLLTLVLAGLGLKTARSGVKWFLLTVLAIAIVLSLGPRLYLTADQASDLILPYRWLYDLLPLLHALRAPVRFEALIMFALAALAGLGLGALGGPRRQRILGFSAVALVTVEYLAVPAANTAAVPVASGIPLVDVWLARQPPSVVLELPMMGADVKNQLDISTQYLSTFHWQRTPDGYSGFNPPGRGEIAYEEQFFPNDRSISLLQALGVKYVVVHFDKLAKLDNSPTREALGRITALRDEADFGADSVYAVSPSQMNASRLDKRLYLPQPAQAGAHYTAYLILANNSSAPFAVKPTDRINLTAHWSDGRSEDLSLPLRFVTSRASVVPITLQSPFRPGKYSLRIEASDSLIGGVDVRGDVQVGNEVATETVIPASVELEQPLSNEYLEGSMVTVRLNWLPLNKIDAYYSVSVRIVDADGTKVEQVDRQPRVPTLLWMPEIKVPDVFELQLPSDLKPGKYGVELLMYDTNGMSSVLLLDSALNPQENFFLGEFQVK